MKGDRAVICQYNYLAVGQSCYTESNCPRKATTIDVGRFFGNSNGNLVKTLNLGAQKAGQVKIDWNGTDEAGNAVPVGAYRFQAAVSNQGRVTQTPVSTYATVQSVSSAGTGDGTWLLNVSGGKSVSLTDVSSVSN